mgnify:CR=1 FL=1
MSKYNGERAYESQLGRMEGLANECYNLIADQRNMGASFSTIFNMAWYGLKPLPLGKRDITVAPSLEDDGIFFGEYVEGVPGVQPERVGLLLKPRSHELCTGINDERTSGVTSRRSGNNADSDLTASGVTPHNHTSADGVGTAQRERVSRSYGSLRTLSRQNFRYVRKYAY